MMRPCVLVFAGSDPGCGAGLQADLHAIAAQGAHALTVVTAVTVQDNDRVYSVNPVAPELLHAQAQALIDKIDVAAVKIGIPGSIANAAEIARILAALRQRRPELPVVLDPVLASGGGQALAADDAVQALAQLLPLATIVLPNLPEASVLCAGERRLEAQAERLLRDCPNVLIKGGHGNGAEVMNTWFSRQRQRSWKWPRLKGEFHGSGCTLASALAGHLARGSDMEAALDAAQTYTHDALANAYAIAEGQRIPDRNAKFKEYR